MLFSHGKRKKHCQCILIEKTQSKVDGITFLFDCDCFLCLLAQQSQSHIFDFFSTSLHKVSLREDTPVFSDCRGGRLFQAPRQSGPQNCESANKKKREENWGEILSNIDRNAKPNLNSASAPKKPTRNKSRESTDPILVLLLSLESQTVVFQPFDFHLRKFKKFIIKSSTCTVTLQHWRQI